MKKHLINIVILLLSATAVLSCSVINAEPGSPDIVPDADGTWGLVISGTASDKNEAFPLEEMKITLHTAAISEDAEEVLFTKTVYTDNRGGFTLEARGFTTPISCIIKAEDPNGIYASHTHEIPLITWDSSYNMMAGVYYINDCDFYLEKAE